MPDKVNTDSVFLGAFRIFFKTFFDIYSPQTFFGTRLDRPKLFIKQLLDRPGDFHEALNSRPLYLCLPIEVLYVQFSSACNCSWVFGLDFFGYYFISSIIILKGVEVIDFRLFRATELAFAIRPKDYIQSSACK